MPRAPGDSKSPRSTAVKSASLTMAATDAAFSAQIDQRHRGDREEQQSDEADHDGPDPVRRGPQRNRIWRVGPNALHGRIPVRAGFRRLTLVAVGDRHVQAHGGLFRPVVFAWPESKPPRPERAEA